MSGSYLAPGGQIERAVYSHPGFRNAFVVDLGGKQFELVLVLLVSMAAVGAAE